MIQKFIQLQSKQHGYGGPTPLIISYTRLKNDAKININFSLSYFISRFLNTYLSFFLNICGGFTGT